MPLPADHNRESYILRPGSEPVEGHRLVRRLGTGGFGEVWMAEARGGFRVALKFVRLDEKAGAIERRSLEILKGIRHPNLLTPFGAWQIPGFLVLAMELADRTLLDRLHEAVRQGCTGVPYNELIEYLAEAANGIDYLNAYQHALEGKEGVGVQHRDIKPQNILLVGAGVKVADFGLARLLEHTVTSHTGSLTVAYAPPEFFQGKTSSRSDQYSLGITYCELRGGRTPFVGSLHEIVAGHMMHPPDLTMLPADERPIVARALAKDPQQRWPSCRAFAEAIRSCRPLAASVPASASPCSAASPADSHATIPSSGPSFPARPGGGQEPRAGADSISLSRAATPPAALPSNKDTPQADRSTTELNRPVAIAPRGRSAGQRRKWNVVLWTAVALPLTAALILRASGIFQPFSAQHPVAGSPITPSAPAPAVAKRPFKLKPPGEIAIQAGGRTSFDLEVERNGSDGPVRLTFAQVPPKVQFQKTTIPDGGDRVPITVEAATDAAIGGHAVNVLARSGEVDDQCTFTLRVARAPSLQLSIPDELTLPAGQKHSLTVRVIRKGIEGPIWLRAEQLPIGVSASNGIIPADNSDGNLELTAADNAEVGQQEITIAASAGYIETRADLKLSLRPAAVGADDQSVAKRVIDKAIKASGGEAMLARYNAVTWKGKVKVNVEGREIEFPVEGAAQPPTQWRVKSQGEVSGTRFERTEVIHGDRGWIILAGQTQEMPEEQLAAAKQDLYAGWVAMLVPLKDRAFKLAPLPEIKLGERPAAGVKVSRQGHQDINLYFDQQSGLLLMDQRYLKDTMGQAVEQETFYSDYQEDNGILYPRKKKTKRHGNDFLQIEITEYKPVEHLDVSVFSEPR